MYGHASDPTRVYAYGAKPPEGESAELIRAQLDHAWRYRNDLVALELRRREAAEEIVREHDPEIVGLDDEIEDVEAALADTREAIRASNARRRSKATDTERAERARGLRARLKDLRAEHKRLRRAAYKAAKEPLAELNEETKEEAKRLRADSGLHWGTYLAVEQGLSGMRSGAPPRFARRATWPGKIAVQIQGGASWDELVEGHGQFRVEIEPLPPHAKPGGRRSKRPYCRAYFRVGSEGRTPVWASARFVLHRPVPSDARAKWVYLVRQRQGTDERWSVQFVLARASGWAHQDTTEADGTVAVDLGWRRLDDGELRVAYAVDERGEVAEELVIGAHQIGRWEKAESLRSIRDTEFAAARDGLVEWLGERVRNEQPVPDWLLEDAQTLAQWRSQARLAALVIRWRDRRFDGDAGGFEPTEEWRRHDKHLYDWEAASRGRFLRWRRDHYRRFAARLRWRYESVVVEDVDWRDLARQKPAEEDDETLNTRWAARIASPGLLRETIEHGHPCVERVDAADTTTMCSTCGLPPAHDWDAAAELVYRCEAGHRMDQDENAARNLLDRASADVAA